MLVPDPKQPAFTLISISYDRVAHFRDLLIYNLADCTSNTAKENQHHTLVDDAAKMLADMEALGTHMSL